MKKVVFSGILAGIMFALFLVPYIYADVAPYPGARLNFFVTYNNQSIERNFSAYILACLQGSCTHIDNANECAEGVCSFYYYRIERTPSTMKLQINLEGKNFTSDVFNFSWTESSHIYNYKVDINPDGKMTIIAPNVEIEQDNEYFDYSIIFSFLCALALTIVIELIVSIFFLRRWKVKKWKKPLLTVALADIISAPLVWIILGLVALISTSPWSMLIAIIGAEAFAVVFEAYFIHWFNKKIISLKRSFILSIVMNVASFVIGGIALVFLIV